MALRARARSGNVGESRHPHRAAERWPAAAALALCVFLLVLAASPQPQRTVAAAPVTIPEIPAGTTVPITTAWGVVSAVFAPIWIAYDTGYFRQFGLDVTLDHIEGVIQAQAIMSGRIQIGNVGGAEILNAQAAGSSLVAILQTTDSPVFELHAQPSIRSIADLKGKTVGITRTGSSTDMAARVLLKNHGLIPGQDVQLLNLNEMGGIIAGLKGGVIQGGVLSYPVAAQATAAGFPVVASTVDEHVHLQQNLVTVLKPYADAHPAVVFAYLKAYLLGLRDFLQKPEIAYAVIGKYGQTDLAAARASYQANLAAMSSSHYVNEEGLKTVQEFGANPKAAQVKLANAYDNHFLRALEQSGFFRRIGLVPIIPK